MRVEVEEDRAVADFIFDKVIEAVKGGESDPDRICRRVLLELTDESGSYVAAVRGSGPTPAMPRG
jgi:hypothetical protein